MLWPNKPNYDIIFMEIEKLINFSKIEKHKQPVLSILRPFNQKGLTLTATTMNKNLLSVVFHVHKDGEIYGDIRIFPYPDCIKLMITAHYDDAQSVVTNHIFDTTNSRPKFRQFSVLQRNLLLRRRKELMIRETMSE